MSVRTFRLFLSSPGDVVVERRRVAAVVSRLNGEFAGTAHIETIRWETENYQAYATFQAQIPLATSCDIVLSIFKWRLGTELPPEFPDRLETGEPYPSGTAYELLTAMAARQRGRPLPDVYAFRFAGSSPRLELDDPNRGQIEHDWALLKSFFDRWFLTPDGHFRSAFHGYVSEDDLEAEVEKLLRRWLADKVMEGRVVAWPDAVKGSPFPGLQAYGHRHASVFFGRGRDVARGVEAWREAAARGAPTLVVVGSSGAGKSSLARAGLVPRLTAPGVVETVDLWRVAAMRPGDGSDGPIATIAAALLADSSALAPSEEGRGPALPEIAAGDARTPAELAELLSHGSRAGARVVVNALDRVGAAHREAERIDRAVRCDLVLLVDQLDELFAGSLAADARDAFVETLGALLATGRVWLLLTLRADLYAAVLGHPGLKALKDAGAAYDLAPPGHAELAEIVRRPAEAAGLAYEHDPATGEGLDERLLLDADRPDMLPLVQLALARLYEGRRRDGDRTVLPFDVYARLGGLTGIIDEAGERALAALGPAEVKRLPQLVRGLAETGGGAGALASTLTIRPMPLSEAAPDETRHRLVDALVAARLLTLTVEGDSGQVRLAHQRVLTDWARARDIVAGSADFYRIRADVERQRQRWEADRRPDLLLPRGLPLAEAESIVERYGDDVGPETRAFIRSSRARAGRARILTAAAAVTFAVVAVVATVQWWAAREQTRLAERNLAVAKEAVRGLVFNIAQGLRSVSGMRVEALHKILETVQVASDRLIAAAPDDPELLRSRGGMFLRFAETYLSAGDVVAARTNARLSTEIFRSLMRSRPFDVRVEGDLSVPLVTQGFATQQSGDLTEALALFEEGLGLARTGARRMPDDPLARQHVNAALSRLGGARETTGDVQGALAAYEEMLGSLRREVAAAPSSGERRRELSLALASRAAVLLGNGDVDLARAAYGEAAEISQTLATENPADADMQASYAVALENLGDVDLKSGHADRAMSRYEAALVIQRELASRDPANADRQHNVAIALERRGNGAFELGHWTDAFDDYSEELRISRKLLDHDPANATHRRSVSIALELVAYARQKLGDDKGMLDARLESLAIRRQLVERQPGNAEARRDLAIILRDVADSRAGGGDAAAAGAGYREAVAISRELSAIDPRYVRAQTDLANMLNVLAAFERTTGDAGLLDVMEEEVAALRRVVGLRPADRDWRRRLGRNLLVLGGKRFLDQTGDGLADVAEAIAIFRELAKPETDRDARRQLAVALALQGAIARSLDQALARSALREAVEIRRSLAAGGDIGTRIGLAIALSELAAVDPEPAPLLREALAILDAIPPAETIPRIEAMQTDLRDRLGRLPSR